MEDLLLGETIEQGLHVGRIERIAESLEKRTSALQLARDILKGIDIKFFQTAWERDLMQAFATVKCQLAYRLHTVGNVDRGQLLAIVKG